MTVLGEIRLRKFVTRSEPPVGSAAWSCYRCYQLQWNHSFSENHQEMRNATNKRSLSQKKMMVDDGCMLDTCGIRHFSIPATGTKSLQKLEFCTEIRVSRDHHGIRGPWPPHPLRFSESGSPSARQNYKHRHNRGISSPIAWRATRPSQGSHPIGDAWCSSSHHSSPSMGTVIHWFMCIYVYVWLPLVLLAICVLLLCSLLSVWSLFLYIVYE